MLKGETCSGVSDDSLFSRAPLPLASFAELRKLRGPDVSGAWLYGL